MIEEARKLISEQIQSHKNPIVMSSFGKDSMVLLDLIKRCGYKLPILFHKEPFEPKKYMFSNRIILEEDYTVYDYPPMRTGIVKNGEAMEIANFYQLGNSYSYLPTGIRENEKGLCGLLDLYSKPLSLFNYPWDLVFLGHKSTDIDPIFGPVPVNQNVIHSDICDFILPLAAFTDTDIWSYIEAFDVPYNDKRYDKNNGYKEFQDITYNPDYFHACINCIDRDKPDVVYCPKVNKSIPNISKYLDYPEITLPSYVGVK